jgi:hypothetical protein
MGILKVPRATTIQREAITLAVGELVYDTADGYLYQGNGVTAGGVRVSDGGTLISISDIQDWPTGLTSTELGYVDGVTSDIQTQLNGKAASDHTHTLDELSDVVITTPATEEVLKFDGTDWVNGTITPGASALDGLSDVVITAPTTNDILAFDGTNWINTDAPSGGGGEVIVSETAPTSPSVGTVWFNSTNGTTYVYYDDGDSSQWVAFGTESQLTLYPNKLTQGIAVAASGASVDFVGIPSWVKRITVSFFELSLSGVAGISLLIGTGNTPVTSGYFLKSATVNTSAAGATNHTDRIAHLGAASTGTTDKFCGQAILTYVDNNWWTATSTSSRNADNQVRLSAGQIQLAGPLDVVSIKTTSLVFDAGTINIMYE